MGPREGYVCLCLCKKERERGTERERGEQKERELEVSLGKLFLECELNVSKQQCHSGEGHP